VQLFKLCPDETGSTAGVRAQAETLNATWEQIPKTSIEMKNNYDMTDVFRSYTNENPIQKIMAPLLKLQKQRDRWRLSLLGVLDLRQHPEFVSWSLGVLVGMFNSKLFSQQRHSSMELCFAQVNSKLFRFISILT
jgi:hypothetical protein